MIESWRPAGGHNFSIGQSGEDEKISATLGIARLPTWRRDPFTGAIKTLIDQYGEIEEILIEEADYGGERASDIFVKFRSELVAEMVKDRIDGELVDGRKLQVMYA